MLIPIQPVPGVCLSASGYAIGKDSGQVSAGGGSARAAMGRWVDATNCEFIAGFPQKIAGWGQATLALTVGIPRAVCPWRDNSGNARVGIGTETHLYYLLGSTLTNITPLRSISDGALTDPVSTTSASRLVDIADSSQELVNGDWVFLKATTAVGGILLNGWYQVSARSGSGYQITFPVAASSSAGPGGGSTDFAYPRVTLTNPFTTTSGSHLVSVAHAASGATEGDYVTFSGAAAVGGLTIDGEYQITSITDANHYVITAASAASSSAGPGGGSVSVIYDISFPTSATGGIGYGTGAYGVGAYVTGYGPGTGDIRNGWTLSAYGNQLLASPIGGTIYIYDPVMGGRAYPMLNAPVVVNAMFVTPERFVVALGLVDNLMAMAWCDQNDYTVWTATPTNTANEGRTLIGGSFFVGGVAIRNGVSLILTDRCAFTMNYMGGQEVYATSQAGDNCGLISPTAICAEGGMAYWMSDVDFWSWNGGAQPLPTDDIRAYVFGQPGVPSAAALNKQQTGKCTVALNRAKRQIRFWYPSGSMIENDVGVIYQYDQPCWSLMNFGRAAGADAELLPQPVSTDTAGHIFYDEIGVDANGEPLGYNLELGYSDISNGDRNADVFGFIPDFQRISEITALTVRTIDYPSDAPRETGQFVITGATGRIDMRADGKAFSLSLGMILLGATFRLGIPRLDVQPSGARL